MKILLVFLRKINISRILFYYWSIPHQHLHSSRLNMSKKYRDTKHHLNIDKPEYIRNFLKDGKKNLVKMWLHCFTFWFTYKQNNNRINDRSYTGSASDVARRRHRNQTAVHPAVFVSHQDKSTLDYVLFLAISG